mgnify:CR=1 FL=1
MEQIDRHGPGSDIGIECPAARHQQCHRQRHGKADAIADYPADDAFDNTLIQIIIVISSIEDFGRKIPMERVKGQKACKGSNACACDHPVFQSAHSYEQASVKCRPCQEVREKYQGTRNA